jgi:hypothetical protein
MGGAWELLSEEYLRSGVGPEIVGGEERFEEEEFCEDNKWLLELLLMRLEWPVKIDDG